MTISYFAVALDAQRRIAQLLVTREMVAPGVCKARRQEWTGVIYPTTRAALADIARLNGCAAART